MICPVCGTSFHYCSSCSISYNWETTYCSEKCWHASPEYTEVQRRFAEIYLALDPAARTQFVAFVDELMCSDFDEFDVREWAQTVIFGSFAVTMVSTHHDRITVADIAGDYIKDTEGHVWYIIAMDVFAYDDLAPGQTLNVTWRNWNSEPSYGEWIWVDPSPGV